MGTAFSAAAEAACGATFRTWSPSSARAEICTTGDSETGSSETGGLETDGISHEGLAGSAVSGFAVGGIAFSGVAARAVDLLAVITLISDPTVSSLFGVASAAGP